mmetsp:Transcript_42425/g.102663  ORF Transcript_42425/g.102663 Transcript_42425/m.102663 type:complete len:1772 (+) Transcript_42425:209-5524(+)
MRTFVPANNNNTGGSRPGYNATRSTQQRPPASGSSYSRPQSRLAQPGTSRSPATSRTNNVGASASSYASSRTSSSAAGQQSQPSYAGSSHHRPQPSYNVSSSYATARPTATTSRPTSTRSRVSPLHTSSSSTPRVQTGAIRTSPIRGSSSNNYRSNSKPAAPLHQPLAADSHVWVRTDLVKAIWDNHGKLPPGWTPNRKRGRDSAWGWMRAQVVQSSSVGGSGIGQHRLKGSSSGKSILVSVKVNDATFAPRELMDATVSFSYESGDVEMACPANIWWKKQDPEAPTDLCSLTHLHEPSVVYCLQHRYHNDSIYTYTGKILLALNPFRVLDGIYGDQVMKQYWKAEATDRPPPHVYAVAQDAYKTLLEMKENQSILVSGESGSGKTVTTKIIMGYLATQSKRMQANQRSAKEGVESQILQSNPILESFGNARTVRNDNSSRFGKYMELLFTPSGTLVSASVQTYLLEKVRLITPAPGERNYHIFYEILAGVSQEERVQLKIANVTARDFRMTASSGTFDRRDGVEDRETYQDLRNALDTIGFSKSEQTSMLSVACALLHISNISFQPTAGDGSALAISHYLQSALTLLGVPIEALNNALCLCAIEARGETFHKNLSVRQAEKATEALIKATYGALFSHIVRTINKSIAADNSNTEMKSLPRIGILDIFGFESFDFNSFEQLCINYCNEALQQQFNRFVFKLEQEEYKSEGIDWSFIDFPDNQEILDLIEKKRVGILSILDENCRLSSQSDTTFVRGVYDKNSRHPCFSGSQTQKASLQFCIKHYAGVVKYDCVNFLEKNKDELPKETTELLSSSSVQFLAYLGDLLSFESSSSTKRGSGSMIRESVGSQFRTQLQELRDQVDATTPHYVRCLKPNDELVPNKFEAHVIADQLRCAGVLEAIRVARVGFPHRFTHGHFLERYGMLAKSKLKGLPRSQPTQRCKTLIDALQNGVLRALEKETDVKERAGLRETVELGMQIGNTKVFARRRVYETLEYLRNRQLGKSAIIIQKYGRRHIAQMNYVEMYLASLTLQCFARRIIARRTVNGIRYGRAVTKIQAQWRRFLAETELIAARLIAHFCQAYARGVLARKLYAMMRVENQATVIQTYWRGYRDFSNYEYRKWATVTLQCLWRRKFATKMLESHRREAKNRAAAAQGRDRLKQQTLQQPDKVHLMHETQDTSAPDMEADDEVTRLKKEVERLQAALTAQGKPEAGSPAAGKGWFSKRGAETGSVASLAASSFSLPGIRRVFSRTGGEEPINETNNELFETPKKAPNTSVTPDTGSTGMSSSISLLDAIDHNDVADFQLRNVVETQQASSPQAKLPSKDLFPLSERRGLEFCRELQRLHDAIRNGDIRTIEQMLMNASEPHVLINEADGMGHSALHAAVIAENIDAAKMLVEHGAFVNMQDNLGQTALHLAFGAPMTSLLLDFGNANPNIPNIDGLCPLHMSVQRFDVGSVRSLIMKGGNADTADFIRWFTPLHVSALPDGNRDEVKMKARRMIVEMLCTSARAKPSLSDQDNEGNTPLHYAVQIETEEACAVISTFLQNGADPRISNKRNQQPLLLLCHNNALRRFDGFQDCVNAMLYNGANPNHASDTGCTALHLSLYHRDTDSALQLINRGAELHHSWRKPPRWTSFWDDMGSLVTLPFDMVQDENTLYRLLATITHPTPLAPKRSRCMNCRAHLGPFGKTIHCGHCGRHVCGACTRTSLAPEFFPKTFDLHDPSAVCLVCEKILVARKEDNSTGTQPISSVGDEDERMLPSSIDFQAVN